jgi:hypothetical protein
VRAGTVREQDGSGGDAGRDDAGSVDESETFKDNLTVESRLMG